MDSVPLIASSIMSKKLAAGSHSIVLDVKVGSGAFMKTQAEGEELARQMVDIATACGRKASALVTNMDLPLGEAVGNTLEVQEAVAVLQGKGDPRLRRLCEALATEMVCLCLGLAPDEAAKRVAETVDNGDAFRQMCRWVEAQGGDPTYLTDPEKFPTAPTYAVVADRDGYITGMDAEAIGVAAVTLGAGRATKTDPIDHAAGIRIHKRTGDRVTAGEPIATLYTNRPQAVEGAAKAYLAAVTVADTAPAEQELIFGVVR